MIKPLNMRAPDYNKCYVFTTSAYENNSFITIYQQISK